MNTQMHPKTLWEGKYLDLVVDNGWEFVRRKGNRGVVGIVPITDEGRLVMVEQFRPPIGKQSIELPAGLVGDTPGSHDESAITAARRELMEETGYEAREMTVLSEGVSTAGLADEMVMLLLARGLIKVGNGDGDGSEKITVHEVPIGEVDAFLKRRAQGGAAIDFKIYAGLYLADGAQRK